MIRIEITADWRVHPPPETFITTTPETWTISLPAANATQLFMAELARVPNARLLALSGTTLAVLVLLLPISLFAVLGNGIYDLLLEEQPSTRLIQIVLFALLIYVILAAVAATSQRLSILSQELGGMIDSFRDITHRFHLRPARIMRQARAWARLQQLERVSRIDLWNPGPPSTVEQAEIFWDILLPLFREHLTPGSLIRLHVRHDEVATVHRALENMTGIVLTITDPPGGSTGAGAPVQVLSAGEIQLLRLLRIASFPLQQLMTCTFRQDNGPLCFSEKVFLQLARHFAAGHSQEFLYRFLVRCRSDYAYLYLNPNQVEILRWSAPLTAALDAEAQQLAIQARQLLLSDARRFVHEDDPTTLIYTINGLAILHDQATDTPQLQQRLKQQLRDLVSETIVCLDRDEHYALFAHLARQEFAEGAGMGEIARRLPRVIAHEAPDTPIAAQVLELTRFNAFLPDILVRLARLLEIGGHYAAATAIWEKLRNLDPLLASIRLARLMERRGDAQGGLRSIRPILAGESLTQRPDIRIAALLEAAWLCYSIGDGNLIETGFAWLKEAEREWERTPTDVESCWRLHNYRALYLDALGQQAEAIEANRMALAIPGIQLKWYSGSLTNLAYVNRKYGLRIYRERKDEAESLLAQSLEYAALAVDLKRRIADIDELPVALHNLALAHLCQALLPHTQVDRLAIQEARACIEEGLALLARTGSHKKRFALLLENALASGLLGEDWHSAFEAARRAPATPRELACLARLDAEEGGFARLCAAVLNLEILD